MTDPVAVLAASAPQAAAATPPAPHFEAADTRMFATLMQGAPALEIGRAHV